MQETRTSGKAWQGDTDGFPWMLKALISILKRVDVRPVYAVMSVVALFYMLINRRNCLAVRDFYRDRLGFRGWRLFKMTYLDHYHFGQVVIDRFAFYAGRHFDMEIENNDIFLRLCSEEKGFLMLSSHIGNHEIAGYSLKSEIKRIHALAYAGEKETVMTNRRRLLKGNNISLVKVSPDLSHLFILNNALEAGDIVSMMGDRVFGSSKKLICPFFGADAGFPMGPFALAAQKDVPIVTVFVMKTGTRSYRIRINEISTGSQEGGIRERMQSSATLFARQLEETVRAYPTQWYNFFDFWNQ